MDPALENRYVFRSLFLLLDPALENRFVFRSLFLLLGAALEKRFVFRSLFLLLGPALENRFVFRSLCLLLGPAPENRFGFRKMQTNIRYKEAKSKSHTQDHHTKDHSRYFGHEKVDKLLMFHSFLHLLLPRILSAFHVGQTIALEEQAIVSLFGLEGLGRWAKVLGLSDSRWHEDLQKQMG